MLARLTTFTVWALVAATAVFWGLRLFVRAQPAPAFAVAVGESTAQRGDLGRLLGVTPREAAGPVAAAPELASRFKLLGVMAAKAPATSGFATIAVDSKPARTYPVGAALDGDLVLQSVSLRSAAIGPAQGAPAVTLEIPLLPPPATGSLPPAPTDGLRGTPPGAPSPPPVPNGRGASPGQVPPGQIQPAQVPPPPQPLPGRLPRTPGATSR
jgi:general secretion pathway protein C